MYELISNVMNERYGAIDMDADLVEDYLRFGDDRLLSGNETVQIDFLYERFL